MRGHKQTIETRKKISIFNKGKKLSEEHKRKIKENNAHYWLGKTNIDKGKKRSLEICKKMSEAKKKFYKDGGVHPLKGIHRSLETKEKIRQKLKGIKIPIEKRLKRSNTLPSGERHHNWKGGINPINDSVRHGIHFRLWREAVFSRDSWTCQKTKIKGGKLCSHHIKNFAEHPELRFAIDNGITLSDKSHREFHKKYGSSHNTLEQLKEFLNK